MPLSSGGIVLLIDGYNVIGAWKTLQRIFQRSGLDAARQHLVEVLTGYSAFRDYESRVIFDAQYRGGSGSDTVITPNLLVQYTDCGQTADTLIEKTCASFRATESGVSQRVIVATSDRAQQLTVVGYGAEWMSAQQLELDVKRAKQELKQSQRQRRNPPGRTIAHTLDAKTLKRMRELRMQGFHPSID
jgi:predicted RNA-binding protein with PIN domain